MTDTSKHLRSSGRCLLRTRASRSCMLLVLGASACGQRFELGDLGARDSQLAEPPRDLALAGIPLLDSISDADAQIAPIPDHTDFSDEAIIAPSIAAGDVDGDGYDDVVIQHTLFDSPPLRYVFRIVYGGPRPSDGVIPIDPGASFGLELKYQYRFSVTPAGDVNGDGLADLFITTGVRYMTWAPGGWRHEYGSDPGPAAYLLYGSAERASTQGVATLSDVAVAFSDRDDIGREVTDELFYKTVSLNALGDIDGDGLDDFALTTSILGDPEPALGEVLEPRGSATHLFYGQSQPFSSDPAQQRPAAKLERVLEAQPLGDVDGDGFGDVILVADIQRILPGSATRRSGDVALAAALPIDGLPPYLATQQGPSAVGDLDQDGYADFVLRDPRIQDESADVHGGYSYLVYGAADLFERERLSADDANATFDARASGWLLPAGDWDADGIPDLALFHYTWVAGQLYSKIAEQELLLLRGSESRFSGLFEAPLLGGTVEPGMGPVPWAPTRLGDLDGDGFADLSVMAANPQEQFRAFVKYGGPVPVPAIH